MYNSDRQIRAFQKSSRVLFPFCFNAQHKISGQISLRGHTSLMFHCCFNCDSIHLSEAFGLPQLKMCWYLSTMILSRIASILQKSFNLKFYDTFPVFLYCFDSYPGRKVELQDCKILAFFQQFLWGIGGKRITRPILGLHAETKVKITHKFQEMKVIPSGESWTPLTLPRFTHWPCYMQKQSDSSSCSTN